MMIGHYLMLVLCLAGFVQASQRQGVINSVKREIDLQEHDVVIIQSVVDFSPGQVNKVGQDRTIMEYVVAADYDSTLVAIEAKDVDTKYNLKVERANGPLSL